MKTFVQTYRKEDAYKKRETELRDKDLKIQESLIKFSKFLQENELKRKKAKDKQENEQKVLYSISPAQRRGLKSAPLSANLSLTLRFFVLCAS